MIATTADRSIAIGDVLDIGAFTPEQALAYLDDGTSLANPDGAGRVALELGRLPLALAGAVWTIARRRRFDHGYGYGQYMEELERQPLDRLLGNDKATPEYPRATVAALALAVEAAIDAAADPELARSVLGALAFLDPSGVPRRWFDALGEKFDVDDVLVVIADSGLAQPSDDTTSVIMHRLVGRVIRDVSDRDGWSARAVAAATALVGAVRPLDREGYWAQRAEAATLAAHVLALVGDSDRGLDEQVLAAGVLAGNALVGLSDPHTAMTVLRPLSAIALRALGGDHPYTLVPRNNLAGAYQSVGDPERTISLYEEIVVDAERILGADHPSTLTFWSNLAGAYQWVGDPGRAVPLYEAILANEERVLGVDHPNTLISRNNLAQAYRSAGDLERAVLLYEATLADVERVLGADHPNTLISRGNLAYAYEAVGDLGRAIPLYEATLADRERVLGADHPDTLLSRNNLAYAYQAVGDLGRAVPLFEATLADRERVLTADHPDTLLSRDNLALALAEDGAAERALSMAHLNAAESRRLFGAEDSRTLYRRATVAQVVLVAGRTQEAIALLTEILADCRRILGDHGLTRMVEERLAQATGEAAT
ncbi:tetratricopeptide repeat protein [Promicromonospora soli]